jgi:hypothetical protein
MKSTPFQGIEGLTDHGTGRKQAWGAAVTIGTRHPQKGYPTDTEKFYIKKPQAISKSVGSRSMLVRENDPDFWRYNDSDKLELRQQIRFHIIHPVNMADGWESMADCLSFSLKAFQLPKIPLHENKYPTCTGDGKTATRWDGKEFQEIKCPNALCEFRQGRPSPCKPYARFAFQLRWPQHEAWKVLPTPLVKFETHSWHNIDRVLLPFFAGIHKQAMALGVNNYNLYGLPGVIKLGKRVAGKGSVVPSIAIATDFTNGQTLQSFFLGQKEYAEQIQAYTAPQIEMETEDE